MAVVTAPIPLALTVIVWTFGEMIFFPTATAYMAELGPQLMWGVMFGCGILAAVLLVVTHPREKGKR